RHGTDELPIDEQRVLGDHDHDRGTRFALRYGLRNRDVLRVRQYIDFGRMREQENDQDRHHVDERHERIMTSAMQALSMTFDAIRSHVGASPREISGNNSALENGFTGS